MALAENGSPSTGASKMGMYLKQPRRFCGALEIQAFVTIVEPGTPFAIYERLTGDKTTYRNGAQGGL